MMNPDAWERFKKGIEGEVLLVHIGEGEEVTGEIVEDTPGPDKTFRVDMWREPLHFITIYRVTVPEVIMERMSKRELEIFQTAISDIVRLTRRFR